MLSFLSLLCLSLSSPVFLCVLCASVVNHSSLPWRYFMTTATTTTTTETDRFQSREELVQYIEEQATTAVGKALEGGAGHVERRVPWAASGPVGQDSAGYSVLKAAAFALGYLGPEQAKEELHVHQQLRELYGTYGFPLLADWVRRRVGEDDLIEQRFQGRADGVRFVGGHGQTVRPRIAAVTPEACHVAGSRPGPCSAVTELSR
jgi:hypothetical protein